MTDLRLVACPAVLRDRAVAIVGDRFAEPPTVEGTSLADLLPAGLVPGRSWPRGDDLVGLASSPGTRGEPPATRLVVLGDAVIGGCGPIGVPGPDGCLEIGYGLAPAYHRRGYGTASVGLLVEELLARPDVISLCAEVLPGNEPSWRLLERLGFVRDEHADRGGHWRYVL